MRHRHELTDTEWARREPLLPPHRSGRPRTDDRLVVNGIVWKLATGAPGRDLPDRYGPGQTVDTRLRRWTLAGTWDQIFAAVQRQADAAGQLDGQVHFVDGTVIRAHPQAAGAKGGTQKRTRWGAVGAATRRRSTCGRRAVASR